MASLMRALLAALENHAVLKTRICFWTVVNLLKVAPGAINVKDFEKRNGETSR
jgi:hypothetical protein